MEKLRSPVEDFNGVGAGEDEPVVGSKTGQGDIESGKRRRGGDFDGGNEDGDGASGFELRGEVGRLMGGLW